MSNHMPQYQINDEVKVVVGGKERTGKIIFLDFRKHPSDPEKTTLKIRVDVEGLGDSFYFFPHEITLNN